jgi:hypothetical protein
MTSCELCGNPAYLLMELRLSPANRNAQNLIALGAFTQVLLCRRCADRAQERSLARLELPTGERLDASYSLYSGRPLP